MSNGSFLEVVPQVFEMIQAFEHTRSFHQHVFGFGGGNQASSFSAKQWKFHGFRKVIQQSAGGRLRYT